MLHAVAGLRYDCALTTLELVLSTNSGRQRDQLDLPQYRHSRSADVGQIDDRNADGNLARSALDHDRVTFADAELQELGVPVIRIVECPVLRSQDHITGTDSGAVGRRSRHNGGDHDSGARAARCRGAGKLWLKSDPWMPHDAVGQKIFIKTALIDQCDQPADPPLGEKIELLTITSPAALTNGPPGSRG
jgi:hypothetical protein